MLKKNSHDQINGNKINHVLIICEEKNMFRTRIKLKQNK